MNLRRRKNHSVSFHYWGWTARPFPLRFAVAGEVFVLTSSFIERGYRNVGLSECGNLPHQPESEFAIRQLIETWSISNGVLVYQLHADSQKQKVNIDADSNHSKRESASYNRAERYWPVLNEEPEGSFFHHSK